MGRRARLSTVKQPVAHYKKGKGGSSYKNVADISLKDDIPTLWSGKHIEHEGPFPLRHPISGVTPELAEDSDVEVSEPTLTFFLE